MCSAISRSSLYLSSAALAREVAGLVRESSYRIRADAGGGPGQAQGKIVCWKVEPVLGMCSSVAFADHRACHSSAA